jgi:hypothetical protein
MIVNGTLETGQTCHLKNCDENPVPPTPTGQVPQHGKWSFESVALRSLSILINQSYRSSIYFSRSEGTALGFKPYFVRIESDHLDHQATINLGNPKSESLSCKNWKSRDVARDKPLEFHPRFMRCLIDYGKKRQEVDAWAKAE